MTTKKKDNSRHSGDKGQREVSKTDKSNLTANKIELSTLNFEDEYVEFIFENGVRWYTGYAVGNIVGYPYSAVTRLYRRKRGIFDDTAKNVIVSLSGKNQSVLCFNRDGILTFLNEVDWPSLEPEDRRDKVVRFRKWMIKTIGDVMDGKIVNKDSLLSSDDLDRIGTSYKSRANMNGLRMRIRRTRYKFHHPGRNLSVKDDVKLYLEDYSYIKGPGKLERNWRQGLNNKEGRSLQAKQIFDMHEYLSDNMDDELRRKNVLNHFKMYAPELITEHMPIAIDTTKQLTLIGEGS